MEIILDNDNYVGIIVLIGRKYYNILEKEFILWDFFILKKYWKSRCAYKNKTLLMGNVSRTKIYLKICQVVRHI